MSNHHCKVMLIHCADPRYSDPKSGLAIGLKAIIKLEQADVYFVPGGGFGASLEFTQAETKSACEHRLKTAKDLGVEKVLLADHLDCAAFAMEFGRMTPEKEEIKHLETIAETKKIVEKTGLELVAYLQKDKTFRKV